MNEIGNNLTSPWSDGSVIQQDEFVDMIMLIAKIHNRFLQLLIV